MIAGIIFPLGPCWQVRVLLAPMRDESGIPVLSGIRGVAPLSVVCC